MTLENRIDQLPLLSEFLLDICEKYGVPKNVAYDLQVAIDEIGTNIVMHAYPKDETHTFKVSFRHGTGELAFTFEDEGVPFDPTQPTDPHFNLPPEERPIGGLGIMIAKKLMDRMEYERKGDKNVLRIIKKY